MKELAIRLWQPRVRISFLLTISLMAMLFCFINLPIALVGLIELAVLTGCVVLFRKIDVTQYELFQYKPHWFWRICEWYWTIWFCIFFFNKRLTTLYPILNSIDYNIQILFLKCIPYTLIVFVSYSILYIFRWIFKVISDIFKGVNRFEIGYLTITSTILIAIFIVICSKTSFFVYPIHKDNYQNETSEKIENACYDINQIFDTDTYSFFTNPMYAFGDDTFRHPLFSVCFMFFKPLLFMLENIIHIFFHSQHYSFALSVGIIQIFLYIMTGILIYRLFLKFTANWFNKIVSIIYICSFPVIFSFVPERLIFSSFFVVLAIYCIQNKMDNIVSLIISCCAIYVTSLSILPTCFAIYINKKLKTIFILCVITCSILLCRNMLFRNSIFGIEHCLQCCTHTSVMLQFKNYCSFITSNILLPDWKFIETPPYGIIAHHAIKTKINFTSLWIVQNNDSIYSTTIGCFILFWGCIGFIYGRTQSIVQILGFWLLISFCIVGIIGFGNDQCVLYCSYFSWAIIPLALLPFYWLWQKFPKLPIPQALYAFAVYLAISNLYFLYQVVQIVSDRYIVPPGM